MPDTAPENAIEIEKLVTHYGDREILKGVDLDIHTGEIMVIMGGSGSGKTTLMRNLLGLNKPTSGSINILGQDITRLGTRELYKLRRKMGVAFQGGALLGSMSVAENIELPLRIHTRLDENTIRIMTRMKLEVVNLAGFEDLMPSQLSGGMLKRASLARSIIMDPSLLFFDEPSSGLDPVVSAELDELILRLKAAMKVTIVVVTHELESAFKIADRITVLGDGQVLMTGTVDEIRSSDNEAIQDMLNRRPRDESIDAEEYLQRLTAARGNRYF
ncbi:MAG: ABC transporter ATP-binding protein [Gammaproteobacteria bacterium]|nr:ABC transporter ATP-binding protein [Gammaproteobacteria bacterium]MDH3560767.1 ABC transporter ATP-binding protein [Gammaproteobacteria bacterium]